MPRWCRTLSLVFSFAFPGPALFAQPPADPRQDLKKLSIEELAQLDVTSVSRRTERLSRTAAAVSVIRQEDLLRAGVSALAEALRLGDAIDVARVNGNSWGITTRGFNISTANKLLVLVDGRSTYSSLFGGTFWDVQDALLGDIERIEVIRGPGGAIWGPNAVNGVVNVISLPAIETQGSIVTVVAGTNEHGMASARFGGQAGSRYYRVYGKYRQRGPQLLTSGGSAEDEVQFGQGGFRVESGPNARARWFVSGDAYAGSIGLLARDDGRTSGGHVLTRWTRSGWKNGEFTLQAYYDRATRRIPLQFTGRRDTGEIDVQQALNAGRHNFVFGSMFRVSDASDRGVSGFVFDPERRTTWIANAFIQDEIELVRDRTYVIAGTKLGRNNFTGLELQPSIRFRFDASARHMTWAAVSRAVRLPTRFDTDLRLVQPVSRAVILTGTEDFEDESVIAVEGGYRALLHPRLSVDAAVFSNRYDNLRSQELRLSPPPLVALDNMMNARTAGIEVAAAVQAAPVWRIHGSYSWLHKTITFDPGSTDRTGGLSEGNDPSHMASVRSALDLPRRLTFDAVFRFVGRRPAPIITRHSELDLRLGWMARTGWELSIIGDNVLNPAHAELTAGGAREEFRRAVSVRSIWRF